MTGVQFFTLKIHEHHQNSKFKDVKYYMLSFDFHGIILYKTRKFKPKKKSKYINKYLTQGSNYPFGTNIFQQ